MRHFQANGLFRRHIFTCHLGKWFGNIYAELRNNRLKSEIITRVITESRVWCGTQYHERLIALPFLILLGGVHVCLSETLNLLLSYLFVLGLNVCLSKNPELPFVYRIMVLYRRTTLVHALNLMAASTLSFR